MLTNGRRIAVAPEAREAAKKSARDFAARTAGSSVSQRSDASAEMNFNPTSTQRSGSEDQSKSTEIAPSSVTDVRPVVRPVSIKEPEQHHYSALAEMVAEVSRDHAHLRAFVYEFARVKLRKELYPRFVEGAWSEIEQQMQGLESAIDQIEREFAQSAPLLPPISQPKLPGDAAAQVPRLSTVASRDTQGTTRFGAGGINSRSLLAHSAAYDFSSRSIAPAGNVLGNTALGRHLRSRSWLKVHLLIAITTGVAIYAAFDAKNLLNRTGLHWSGGSTQSTSTSGVVTVDRQEQPKSNDTRRHGSGDTSVPTEYGAYAIVNGRLIELEQLAIRVPDPRVAISAAISIPSRAHLPSSPQQFIVFRKDLLNSAPERAAVRVVAQVVRALSFDASGHPKSSNVEQSWVIRNNAYPMRVGPLPNNPEMIVVRSESAGFALPAGRYVLVLKGIGYDFTIDGPVTDPTHCLERTEALNAPIYSECPKQ